MELTDASIINGLLAGEGAEHPSRASTNCGPAPRTTRRPQCTCGHCPPCLDNLRWQRIFDEKFADPDYYNRPCLPRGSSLHWQ
jgi:hypothetical protein